MICFFWNQFKTLCGLFSFVTLVFIISGSAFADDLEDIRQRGVLRHLGIPYANFVNSAPDGLDGLDVELMQRFADHLGVAYEWVETSWPTVFGDLTGQMVQSEDDGSVLVTGHTEVRGDIISNGLTILPWRKEVVDFSVPTFPTGVWLIARVDSQIKPIKPSGDIHTDIDQVKNLLAGQTVLTMNGTCLDARLYDLYSTWANIREIDSNGSLDEIVPAIVKGFSETALIDIPNALVALLEWPGDIKVIGPISEPQQMAVAVSKSSPALLAEFNRFFLQLKASGAYDEMVHTYYPSIYLYLGGFFSVEERDAAK
jgi:ABC-type amino acid transport substrate-binding protein